MCVCVYLFRNSLNAQGPRYFAFVGIFKVSFFPTLCSYSSFSSANALKVYAQCATQRIVVFSISMRFFLLFPIFPHLIFKQRARYPRRNVCHISIFRIGFFSASIRLILFGAHIALVHCNFNCYYFE